MSLRRATSDGIGWIPATRGAPFPLEVAAGEIEAVTGHRYSEFIDSTFPRASPRTSTQPGPVECRALLQLHRYRHFVPRSFLSQ